MLVLECSVICILYLLQVSENDNKTELVIFGIQKYLHGSRLKFWLNLGMDKMKSVAAIGNKIVIIRVMC